MRGIERVSNMNNIKYFNKLFVIPIIVLIVFTMPSCSSAHVSVSPSSTQAPIVNAIPSNTLEPTIAPTATSHLAPITRSQVEVEAVLIINGFVHRPDLDGVDTCRVDGCKVYDSTSIGINAWAYLDGSLFLLINSGDQYNASMQDMKVTHVITQLFGDHVNTWICDHRSAAMIADQEGIVDGYKIAIDYTDALGYKLTMIVVTKA
jgi:hypothetical protein